VREISQLGGDVSQMVSGAVAARLAPKPLQA
jgi:pantetheine-phosphate adenylyltransferase